VRERPLLMSGPMVRAILAGTKTQTRRVLSLPPTERLIRMIAPSPAAPTLWDAHGTDELGLVWHSIECPYGVPGDRLWVRETFQPFFKDGWIYLADAGTHRMNAVDEAHAKASWPRWKPSIHMPRVASRITLEVTDVRVQRLQDISGDDARAEGIPQMHGEAVTLGLCAPTDQAPSGPPSCRDRWDNRTSVENYAALWDSINEKRAPWDSNPWVWCVGFRRCA
jgi:hypothetical protein